MAERGHDVYLLTMHKPVLNKIDRRVRLHLLPFPAPIGYFLNAFYIKKLVKKINPDIINTHYASGYGTLARLVNYSPNLLSVWGSDVFDFPYRSKYKRRVLEKNLEAATQIASTSWVMKKQTEKFVTPRLPIIVTPFGVDMNVFTPKRDYKNSNIYIGIVKKIEEIYGVKYLLEGTALLLNKLRNNGYDTVANNIRLLIIGEGSQLNEMENLSKSLKISEITSFIGSVPHNQVPGYLNKLDIYCAPSLRESFGVAILEASACGIPVIVSNVGGLPEVVLNDETGYIVEPRNSNQISDKLYELVLDSEKRERFGKQGRQFVDSHYNWEKNVSFMESIYHNLSIDKLQ
jgi:glycosyltransferase involved in cell wall biosynthesis